MFCGKMGAPLRQKSERPLFVGVGGDGVVVSNMPEERWGGNGGELGKNTGKTSHSDCNFTSSSIFGPLCPCSVYG